MAGAGRAGRFRIGDGERHPDPALSGAPAGGDRAAERANGVGERDGRVGGRRRGRGTRFSDPATVCARHSGPREPRPARVVYPRSMADLDLPAADRHPDRAGADRSGREAGGGASVAGAGRTAQRYARGATVSLRPRLPFAPSREPGLPLRWRHGRRPGALAGLSRRSVDRRTLATGPTPTSRPGTAAFSTPRSGPAGWTTSRTWPRRATFRWDLHDGAAVLGLATDPEALGWGADAVAGFTRLAAVEKRRRAKLSRPRSSGPPTHTW